MEIAYTSQAKSKSEQTYYMMKSDKPKSQIFFLPGYTQRSDSYAGFFKPFADKISCDSYVYERKNEAVKKSEIRMHGEKGFREKVNEKEILEEYWKFFDEIEQPDNVPRFLFGHSLGALYATRLCQQRPDYFKGVILLNPLFELRQKISAF